MDGQEPVNYYWPVTVASEADSVAGDTQRLIGELSLERANYFTVAEIQWLFSVNGHTRWGTTVEQERGLNDQMRSLAGRVQERKATK